MTERIDKIYRENLETYSSEVSAGTWAGIVDGMAQQKRRKRWLWFILASVILTSALLTFVLISQEDQGKEELQQDIPSSIAQHNLNETGVAESEIAESQQALPFVQKPDKSNGLQILNDVQAHKFQIGNSQKDAIPVHFASQKANTRRFNYLNNPEKVILSPKYPVRPTNLHPFRCNIFPEALNSRDIHLSTNLKSRFKSKTLGDCFDGPPSRWMVGFRTSLDYPFKRFEDLSNAEFIEYLNQRHATESQFLSFSAGLEGGYFHPSGAHIRAGVQYSQINEKFLLVKENVIKIQTHITIDTMINSDGSYTISRDTSIVEVLGREELKTTNHFRMLDVPLIVGYSFDWRHVKLELNGGIIFNIASSNGGRIYNTELIPTYFGTKGTVFQPYKNRYGVSLYGSVTLLSNFYGRSQLFLEPNARIYLKSFSSPDYPLRQKYLVVGLSTGMRYYF